MRPLESPSAHPPLAMPLCDVDVERIYERRPKSLCPPLLDTLQYNLLPNHLLQHSFCSALQPSSIRGLTTPCPYFLYLSLSSAILIDSSTVSPVHVLTLSIQAVRVLPRLRFTMVWPCGHGMLASFALTVCNRSLSVLQLC